MYRRRGPVATLVGVISVVLMLSLVGSASAANNTVKTKLSGKDEPHDADPDGRGEFKAKLKKKKVCYDVSFEDIGNPIVAHIHKGPKKQAGPPIITLFDDPAGVSSPVSACVKAKKKLIKKIKRNPQAYYVNLHTDEFPEGAIRGQLKKGGGGGSGSSGGGGGGSLPY
jgi:CHRD domain